MFITYIAFVVLLATCVGLQYLAIKSRKDPSVGNNPIFLKFQNTYFAAYLPAMFADWLQGPYLYKLYSHYGFQEDQIAILYVCGFASTVLLGTFAPIAADRYGRKKLCIMFTLIYSVACLLKLSRNYWTLVVARILGGAATSLLFSAFEGWYIHEHIETNDFPTEWIPVTFSKATVWNGGLAISAGVLANVVAEWCNFGPVSPFLLAIPCLVATCCVVSATWQENIAKKHVRFSKSCMDGLKEIMTEPRIFLIGTIQSLFEGAMYIFIFLWTPILDPGKASLGITFSSFMVCIMIGSAIFQLMVSNRVPAVNLLAVAIILALFGNLLCIMATNPDNMNRNLAFIAFLLIEVAVGMYFPAMTFIRERLLPEANRLSILNWFRVPINLIACAVLMILHNHSFRQGNRLLFVACSGLLIVASLCILKFIAMFKDDDELKIDNGTSLSSSETESLA